MSETLEEKVVYGSLDIDAIPYTDSDHAWSTHENDSQDKVTRAILITKITIVEISSQHINFNYLN